jgi:hypothetical protein
MQTAGHSLGNISSLAFGGAHLKTAFLGCLLDARSEDSPAPWQALALCTGIVASVRADKFNHNFYHERERGHDELYRTRAIDDAQGQATFRAPAVHLFSSSPFSIA